MDIRGYSLKFSGTFKKGTGEVDFHFIESTDTLNLIGSYSVRAKDKWDCVFQHTKDQLKIEVCSGERNSKSTSHASPLIPV